MTLDIRLVPDHFDELPVYLQIIYEQHNYMLMVASFSERIMIDLMIKIPQFQEFLYLTNSYQVAVALSDVSGGRPDYESQE